MSDTISIEVDRFEVIRLDSYELPVLMLVTEDEVHPDDEDAEPVEVVVEADCWGYYDPGVTCGPPERCYPPEGDFEVTEVELPDYPEGTPFTLTEQNYRELEERYFDQEPDFDPPDDYDEPYDSYYDYM